MHIPKTDQKRPRYVHVPLKRPRYRPEQTIAMAIYIYELSKCR